MAEEAADHESANRVHARALRAEEVSTRSFPTAFRGFDPVAVRAFLSDLADELRAAAERESALRAEVEELSRRAAAENRAPTTAGEEAGAIVEEARRRAAELESGAAAQVEAVLVGAREKADRMLADAEAEAAAAVDAGRLQAERVREEAEQDARRIRAEGERAGAAARVDADRRATEVRRTAEEEAAQVVEAARERGRQMVSEAQAARERMLADLSRRKRSAQAQLEQLRTARDRLLETLKAARRGLDEVTLRFEAADMISAARATEGRGRPEPGAPAAGESGGAQAGEPAPTERPSRPHVVVETTPSSALSPSPSPSAAPAAASPASAAPAAASSADEDEPREGGRDQPPVRAEEERPQNGDRGERRSSALRILRRNRQPEPRAEARPSARVEPVPEPPQPGEGVRIIGPRRAADAVAEDTVREAAAQEQAAGEPAEEQGRAGRTDEPEPSSEAAPEPEGAERAGLEDDVTAAAEPSAPASDEEGADTERPVAEAVITEAAAEEGPAEEAAPADAAADKPSVDELFAQIRRDREEAVQKARQVLDREATSGATEHAGAAPEQPPSEPEPGEAAAGDDRRSDGEESLLQRRDQVLDELEPALVRRLKRALQDEQNAALDRLRTHRGTPTAAAVIPAESDEHRVYRDVAVQYLAEAARAGTVGAPLGPAPVSVDDLADALAAELARNVRSRLERALEEGAREGADVATVAERVSAVFRESKTHRAGPLGNHYLVAAYARGSFVATPDGERLRWVVDDENACPDCDDNALAGPTPRGQPFPTGQLLPPAHVGCRCLLVPADL